MKKTYVKLFGIAGFVLFSSCTFAGKPSLTIINATNCHVQSMPGYTCALYSSKPKGQKRGPGSYMKTYDNYNPPQSKVHGTYPVGATGIAPLFKHEGDPPVSAVVSVGKYFLFPAYDPSTTLYLVTCDGGTEWHRMGPILLKEIPTGC